MRAEDRTSVYGVFEAVNREAARLVGAACDVYASLCPCCQLLKGRDYLATWTARITGLGDQST